MHQNKKFRRDLNKSKIPIKNIPSLKSTKRRRKGYSYGPEIDISSIPSSPSISESDWRQLGSILLTSNSPYMQFPKTPGFTEMINGYNVNIVSYVSKVDLSEVEGYTLGAFQIGFGIVTIEPKKFIEEKEFDILNLDNSDREELKKANIVNKYAIALNELQSYKINSKIHLERTKQKLEKSEDKIQSLVDENDSLKSKVDFLERMLKMK